MNHVLFEDKARYVEDLTLNLLELGEFRDYERAKDFADVIYDVAVRQIPRLIEFRKIETGAIRKMELYSVSFFDPYTTLEVCVQVVERINDNYQPRRFRLSTFLNSIKD